MTVTLLHVDAFSAAPFGGNPAAVCILPEPREAVWMQRVAMEMNLSETAFLCREGEGFHLRWFTPAVEVPLCGHATLASAHALWESGVAGGKLRFRTLSGWLEAEREGERIAIDLPAGSLTGAACPEGIRAALGVQPVATYEGSEGLLIEAADEDAVRSLAPDFRALREQPGHGVMVTAAARDPDLDFVSRYFAPWVGIDEDPVTGAAHTFLGPFWGARLGKRELRAFQASERGGHVWLRLEGERVRLSGHAVTVSRGQLLV